MRRLWGDLFDDIINLGKIFSMIILKSFRDSFCHLRSGFSLVDKIFFDSLIHFRVDNLFILLKRLFGLLTLSSMLDHGRGRRKT
jgi:hypothetical protein